METITDPLNRVASFQYDDAGRVTQQTLPGNRVIGFNYDANGNLSSLTPLGKPQHAFDYTEVDLMKEYEPPTAANVGTRVTTYSYDSERKPTLITRPDGQTIDFNYDFAGRLSTLNLPGRQLTYGYNGTTGNLTSVTDSAGSSLAYTYDGSLPKSATWAGPVSGSVAWNYDNNFRITSRSVNGASINFGYDNDGLLTQSGALTLSRNPQNGLLSGTTLGSVTDSWTYNNFAEPTAYTAAVAGTSVYSTAFTRDKLGRIASKTEAIQGVTENYVYGYDTVGRLETVTKNGTLISQYTYDTNGNRLTRATAAGIATYTTDNQDRLTTWNLAPDTWNLTYTANGELQSKTNGSETTTYQYDVVGNLRHVGLPDGTQIDYVADAQNRRVGKKVNGVLVQGWLYGNQLNPIAELDGSNQIVSTFVYGSRANVPDYMVKGGITYRIISDHLGSPRLIINTTNGTVAQRLDYDEFGNIAQDTNPGFQPFGFAGGLYDNQTKLTRFGARDYDAQIARWTTKDPIRFDGGDTNLYGYVVNDPVNLIDPSGRDFWDMLGGLSDFSNGFADTVTSGFGLTDLLGLRSLNQYIQKWMGTDDLVDPCDGLYNAGQWAGRLWSILIGPAATLNGGARSVFYSGGREALDAARAGKGVGVLLEDTIGGRILNAIDRRNPLPKGVWDAASSVFALNSKGTVPVFLRGAGGPTWNRIEAPILNMLGRGILPK